MSENVKLYSIENPLEKPLEYDRKLFYQEQVSNHQQGIEPQYAVEVINIFLINTSGEIIIQKRAAHKGHNPNLLDKSIGGHIQRGDTVDYTVMVETVQELQVPSLVVQKNDSFIKRYEILESYLNTIALMKFIDTKLLKMPKIIDDREIPIYNMTHTFFGIYGGSSKLVDREAKGILLYDFDDLKKEINKYPKSFTQDIITLITLYDQQIQGFIDITRKL